MSVHTTLHEIHIKAKKKYNAKMRSKMTSTKMIATPQLDNSRWLSAMSFTY